MKKRTKAAAVGMAVVGAAVVSGGVAVANAPADDEGAASITGRALDRASEAALEETGGGRVTETEVGDEESYYEVEVTLAGGGQTDVQLDRDFKVVATESDGNQDESGRDESNDD